jgi:hypothetical protein
MLDRCGGRGPGAECMPMVWGPGGSAGGGRRPDAAGQPG